MLTRLNFVWCTLDWLRRPPHGPPQDEEIAEFDDDEEFGEAGVLGSENECLSIEEVRRTEEVRREPMDRCQEIWDRPVCTELVIADHESHGAATPDFALRLAKTQGIDSW